MKRILFLLVPLLLGQAVSVSRAEVLIYKGTAAVISTSGPGFPPVIELFLTLDIAQKKFASIVFFKAGGEKRQIAGPPSDVHMTTSPAPNGTTARLISKGEGTEALPDFSDTLTYFRGAQKTLTVATTPLRVTRNEPRLLKGIQFQSRESSGDGGFIEGRFKLTFEGTRTIEANNAAQTMEEVLAALAADLSAKGYNP